MSTGPSRSIRPSTPKKKKGGYCNHVETTDQEMDAFFQDVPPPLDSPTLQTKKGRAASLASAPNYLLSPPPPLRDSVLFSGRKQPMDMVYDDDIEESPSGTYIKDDDQFMSWHNTSYSSSATSSSEPDSIILCTPPQQSLRTVEGSPKAPKRPPTSDVLVTPESPAAKYGTGAPFIRIHDSLLQPLSSQ